jgi:hypothetical protein
MKHEENGIPDNDVNDCATNKFFLCCLKVV